MANSLESLIHIHYLEMVLSILKQQHNLELDILDKENYSIPA